MTKLGINCTELTLLAPDDIKRVMADIAAFGFRNVRFEVAWQLVAPTKGAQDWDAVRQVRDAAKANGITLLPILGVHMAQWAYTPADFGAFCARAATELQAPAYEIGNEPNLQVFNPFGDPAPIVPFIQKGWSGIKGVQPAAKVVFPGLAAAETFVMKFLWWSLYGNTSPEDFLTGALKLGVGPFFDVMAYHPYSLTAGFAPEKPSASQPMMARIPKLQKLAGRPLWLTEWGYDYAKTPPTTAATWFNAQLPLMGDGSYFFAWRDYVGHGGTYGLVDANNNARQPIYDTVRKAIS